MFYYLPCGASALETVTFPHRLADQRLHRALLTIDQDNISLHVDGVVYTRQLASSCITDCLPSTQACTFTLGARPTSQGIASPYVGTIVDLSVYPLLVLTSFPQDVSTTAASTTSTTAASATTAAAAAAPHPMHPSGLGNVTFTRVHASENAPGTALLSDLSPHTAYHCVLCADSDAGSRCGAVVSLQTPPAPPRLVVPPTVTDITAQTARVAWQAPGEPNAAEVVYDLVVRTANTQPAVVVFEATGVSVREVALDQLQPFTAYTVALTVRNTAGSTAAQPTTLTTLAAVPAGLQPAAILAGSVQQRSAAVSVAPVAAANGPDVEYLLYVQEVAASSAPTMTNTSTTTSNATATNTSSNASTQAPLRLVASTFDAPATVELKPLLPGTTYRVGVQADNGVFNTSIVFSADVLVTLEARPQQQEAPAPSDLLLAQRSITFQNAPVPRFPNGRILHYRIWLNGVLLDPVPSDDIVGFVLRDLTPATEYNVSTAACNSVGCARPPAAALVSTRPAAPEGLAPPRLAAASNTSAVLAFAAPQLPNGQLAAYKLVVEQTHGCVQADPVGCALVACASGEELCGDSCFDPNTHVCCDDAALFPRADDHQCCGVQYVNATAADPALPPFECCGGSWAPLPENHVCCGGQAVLMLAGTTCCDGVLAEGDTCCGQQGYFAAAGEDKLCCAGRLFDALAGRQCCGDTVIPASQTCCSGTGHDLAPTQQCCGSEVIDLGSPSICCPASEASFAAVAAPLPTPPDASDGFVLYNSSAVVGSGFAGSAACCSGSLFDSASAACAVDQPEAAGQGACSLPLVTCTGGADAAGTAACGSCGFDPSTQSCHVFDAASLTSVTLGDHITVQGLDPAATATRPVSFITHALQTHGRQLPTAACTSFAQRLHRTLLFSADELGAAGGEGFRASVDGLLPGASYTAQLLVTNEVGSVRSEASAFTAAPASPQLVMPPAVAARADTWLQLHVHRALREHAQNVSYAVVLQVPGAADVLRDVAVPAAAASDEDSTEGRVATWSPSHPVRVTVHGLQPHTEHSVRVRACAHDHANGTQQTVCALSPAVTVATAQAAPPTAGDVDITTTQTAVRLAWQVTAAMERNGQIALFSIVVRGHGTPGSTDSPTTAEQRVLVTASSADDGGTGTGAAFTRTFSGFSPFEAVTIVFSACTRAGCTSQSLHAQTAAAAAADLSPLRVASVSARSVALWWRYPATPNGVISAFVLERDGQALATVPVSSNSTTTSGTAVTQERFSFVDDTAQPFEQYSYGYRAVNQAGASLPVLSSNGTVQTLPAAPEGASVATLTVTGDTSVGLVWEEPQRRNDDAVSYVLFRSEASPPNGTNTTAAQAALAASEEQGQGQGQEGLLGTRVYAGTQRTFLDTGLQPFTDYFYVVAVVNSVGSAFAVQHAGGGDQELVAWTPARTSQALAAGVQPPMVTPLSSTSLRALALIPDIPNGRIVSFGLEIRRVRASGLPPFQPLLFWQGASPVAATATALQPFAEYEVRALVTNGAGTTASAWAAATTCSDAPTVPSQVRLLRDADDAHAQLAWNAPLTINGDPGAVTYELQLLAFAAASQLQELPESPVDVGNGEVVETGSGVAALARNFSLLASNTYHRFIIKACGANTCYDSSDASDDARLCGPATGIDFRTAPGAPTGLTPLAVAIVGTTAIRLSWGPPAQANADAVAYTLTRNGTQLLHSDDGSQLDFVDTGVVPGVTYVYAVTVTTAGGAATAVADPVQTRPGAPEGVALPSVTLTTRVSDVLGRFCWTAPLDSKGVITSYTLHVSRSGAGGGGETSSAVSAGTQLCTDVSLLFDTAYTVYLEACNTLCGSGPLLRFATSCGAPTAVSARVEARAATSLSLAWALPSLVRCGSVTYGVSVTGPGLAAGAGAGTSAIGTREVSALGERALVLEDLLPASTYAVVVTAVTRGGQTVGPVFLAETAASPPEGVTIPDVTVVSNTSVVVAWDLPLRVNGPMSSLYFVVVQNGAEVRQFAGTVFAYTARGLKPNTVYAFSVAACSSAGCTQSLSQSVRTLEGVPASVASPVVDAVASRAFALTWARPSEETGALVRLQLQVEACAQIGTDCFASAPSAAVRRSLSVDPNTGVSRYTLSLPLDTTFYRVNSTAAVPYTYHRARVVYATAAGATARSFSSAICVVCGVHLCSCVLCVVCLIHEAVVSHVLSLSLFLLVLVLLL